MLFMTYIIKLTRVPKHLFFANTIKLASHTITRVIVFLMSGYLMLVLAVTYIKSAT